MSEAAIPQTAGETLLREDIRLNFWAKEQRSEQVRSF